MIHKKGTKYILAESLLEIVKKKPLYRITVQDIVANCSMSRKSFYYHFNDKSELVRWIYVEKSTKIIDTYFGKESLCVTITRLLRFVKGNAKFYLEALQETDYTGLRNSLIREKIQIVIDFLRTRPEIGMLTHEIRFSIHFYIYAYVDIMEEWLKNGMVETPAELAELITRAMPNSLKEKFGDVTKPAKVIDDMLASEEADLT